MSDLHTRVEALFEEALKLPPAERPTFLAGACGGDAELRRRVEELLAAEADAGRFLPESPQDADTLQLDMPELEAQEGVGQTLGRYKLLERVGEGGCGVVYVAEQTEPVRRRVALKVIKLGMDTKAVVARFEAERQALAMMDHPNIARVLDAGATDTGRPYFVMELVRGIRITDFCDQAQLSTRDRIDLFIKVCQAIQHAHQKGIIHRDIKPSNILVTLHDGVPVPKVIDFGIAKATEGRLTDATVYTQLHQFIGTPAYMSPEQAEMSGLDIDTRSDIYSLGVLLYELLAGSTPFDAQELMASGLDKMRKTIREQEPPRPSTRLATLGADQLTTTAKRRSAETSKLVHQLQGDLDWIVMKCLEKDRQRRYDTANGLAADLKRHLGNEPVLARPPSPAYRLQKAFRRYRLLFTSVGAVILALIVGLAISVWQYQGKSRAERSQAALRVRAEEIAAEASRAREEVARQRDLARVRLHESLVREAQSIRKNRQLGYRREVFDRLRQALALSPTNADSRTLRREAAATLGDWVALDPVTIELGEDNGPAALAPDGSLAAFSRYRTNLVSIRDTRTGGEVASLAVGDIAGDLIFDRSGKSLFVAAAAPQPAGTPEPPPGLLERWSARDNGFWRLDWSQPVRGRIRFAATEAGPVALMLTPDNTQLAVLDLEQRTELARLTLQVRLPRVPTAAISGDRTQLAFFSLGAGTGQESEVDAHLELWDVPTARRRLELMPRLGLGMELCFSADGKSLIASYQDQIVGYDTAQLGREFTFERNADNNTGSGIALSGGVLAIPVVQELTVRLVRPQTGREVAVLRQPSLPTGQRFSRDGSVLLLNHYRGAQVVRLKAEREKTSLDGHLGGVPAVEFSPDGRYAVSTGKDRTLRFWDLTGRGGSRILGNLPAPGQTLAFTPDGQFLACAFYNTGAISIWSTRTWEQIRFLPEQTNRAGTTWSCVFSPDGKRLAAIGSGLRVWDSAAVFGPGASGQAYPLPLLSEDRCWGSVDFDPASRRIGYKTGWDSIDGVMVRDLESPGSSLVVTTNSPVFPVQVLDFLPRSGALAHVTKDRAIEIVDPANGRQLRRIETLEPGQSAGTFVANLRSSPDESKLAVVSPSGLGVDLWDPSGGRLRYSLPEEPGTIWWLAWSPDSQHLAVSRANGEIAIWHLKEVEAQLVELGLRP